MVIIVRGIGLRAGMYDDVTQRGTHTGQPMQCSLQFSSLQYACNLILEIHLNLVVK